MSTLTSLLFSALVNLSVSGLPVCTPPELQSTLKDVQHLFGDVKITSHFRPGATVAGTNRRSFHATCKAVDFNVPAHKYWDVVRWLKQEHKGGIGTYSCGKYHIHIDNGPARHWHTCADKRMRNDVAMTASINKARRHTKPSTSSHAAIDIYSRKRGPQNSKKLSHFRRTKSFHMRNSSLRRMFEHANKP